MRTPLGANRYFMMMDTPGAVCDYFYFLINRSAQMCPSDSFSLVGAPAGGADEKFRASERQI
jgi:hypothetical protein